MKHLCLFLKKQDAGESCFSLLLFTLIQKSSFVRRRTATTQQNSDSYVVSFPNRNYKAQFSKSLTNMNNCLDFSGAQLPWLAWHGAPQPVGSGRLTHVRNTKVKHCCILQGSAEPWLDWHKRWSPNCAVTNTKLEIVPFFFVTKQYVGNPLFLVHHLQSMSSSVILIGPFQLEI